MSDDGQRSRVRRHVPLAGELAQYRPSWLTGDLAAAITVWAIVVPESMAYASVAGMPPETGLYAATVPLLLYAVFGSSRRITVGPSAAVAALSFATIAPFVAAGSDEFAGLTVVLALMVGLLLVLGGIARLGVIAEFLSEPVLKGFIVGVALTVALGQAGKLFRIETEAEGFFAELWELVVGLPDLHGPTLAVGAASLVALFTLERVLPRIPAALIVVVGSILAVQWLDLAEAGVAVAGEIPSGLPSLSIPTLDLGVVLGLVPGAIGMAIVVYGESMALAKTFASKHREEVDANQELYALGAANVAGGLFGSFAVPASNSRTAAADAAGQRTQVSSLITVALLVVTLLFLTSLFADLPEAALGAIVIHAVVGLIRPGPIARLRRRNAVDFWAAVATLLGVLVLDVLAGLIIGVVVSLVGLMARAANPRIRWLGRDPSTGLFGDVSGPGFEPVPGVAIVRVEEELFFANVGAVRTAVLTKADEEPGAIVFDAEAVSDVDTTAADQLLELLEDLERRGVRFAFARLSSPVRGALEAAGIELAGADFGRVALAVAELTETTDPDPGPT